MEVFKRKTRAIINLFLRGGVSFPSCITSLDTAFAELVPRLKKEQIPELRALTMANNETVMKEMERRGVPLGLNTAPF